MPSTRYQASLARPIGSYQHSGGLGGWANSAIRNYRLAKTFLPPLAAAAQATAGYFAMPYPRKRLFRRKRSTVSRFARLRRPRYKKKPFGTLRRRRGRRYMGKKANIGRRLNTNFTRNDYRTVRVSKRIGDILVAEGIPLANNSRWVNHLDHWTTEWAREIESYEEFRFKDVQFVIEPRSVVTGATRIEMQAGELPYLAAHEVTAGAAALNNVDKQLMQNTPGYRFIPVQTKRRHVINVTPQIVVNDSLTDGAGSLSVQRIRRAGWMKVTTDTKTLDQGVVEIRRPALATGAGNQIAFDVYVYATLMLRGNKDELVAPYV